MIRTLLTAALSLVLAGPAWAAGPADSPDNAGALPLASTAVSTTSSTAALVIPTTLSETTAVLGEVAATPTSTNTASPCVFGIGRCASSGSIRPAALPMLYVGSVLLNGFDTYSTMRGLSQGAREANPLMQAAVAHPAAFVAVKVVGTALPIMAAEQLWKQNHRVAAVVAMVATNGFMSWVAVHNASVLRHQGR